MNRFSLPSLLQTPTSQSAVRSKLKILPNRYFSSVICFNVRHCFAPTRPYSLASTCISNLRGRSREVAKLSMSSMPDANFSHVSHLSPLGVQIGPEGLIMIRSCPWMECHLHSLLVTQCDNKNQLTTNSNLIFFQFGVNLRMSTCLPLTPASAELQPRSHTQSCIILPSTTTP